MILRLAKSAPDRPISTSMIYCLSLSDTTAPSTDIYSDNTFLRGKSTTALTTIAPIVEMVAVVAEVAVVAVVVVVVVVAMATTGRTVIKMIGEADVMTSSVTAS